MILVTGATGFVGRHVLAALEKDSEKQDIRIFVPESERGNVKKDSAVRMIAGDLLDPAVLEQAVSGVETVVHLAGKNIDHDGTGFQSVNVEGTRLLCQAAVNAGVKKMIYLSSVGVYGHRKLTGADENTSVKPDTAFSRSKAMAEEIILDHSKGMYRPVLLRHRFVYGEGDRYFIPRILGALQKHPFLIGGGRARLSVILVDDLADIIVRFVTADPARIRDTVYHVTDGIPLAYRELSEILCRAYSLEMPRKSVPFWPLFIPVRIMESIRRIDPETTKSSISSIRLKLVGVDNYFSSARLLAQFPDIRLTPFAEAFPQIKEVYRSVIEK